MTNLKNTKKAIKALQAIKIARTMLKKTSGKYTNFTNSLDSIIQTFAGKTLIFFDTETTGLNPNIPWVQITEFAAIAYEADSWKELGRIHRKLSLEPRTIQEIDYEKENSPRKGKDQWTIQKTIDRSNYSQVKAKELVLKEGLQELVDFINSYKDPILVIQNVPFDMKQLMTALKRLDIEPPKYSTTMDTKMIVQMYLHPLLNLLMKIKSSDEKIKNLVESLKDSKGRLQSGLEILRKAFNITSAGHWHEALADTVDLASVFKALIEFLYNYREYTEADDFKKEQIESWKRQQELNKRDLESKKVDRKFLQKLKKENLL